MLMTGISMLYNLSMSVGCALLAATDSSLLIYIVGGNVAVYLVVKVARNDFWFWPRVEGVAGVFASLLQRLVTKVIVDFTGLLHFRHAKELGGALFTASMVWAQIFPFVALEFFFEGEMKEKEELRAFLITSCVSWFVLNVVFFATINRSHIHTFFSTKTAPHYISELFTAEGTGDKEKFKIAFRTRKSYTNSIHDKIKQWVTSNLEDWQRDEPTWFRLEDVPDEYLPASVVAAKGGAKRRRSSVSVRELLLTES